MHKGCNVLVSAGLLFWLQSPKHAQQGSVEPFHHALSHGVVGRHAGFLNSYYLAGFFDFSLKVHTLIRIQFLGEPVMNDECIEENFCSGS